MDATYILAREQTERALAVAATHQAARAAHLGMADRYRGMIDDHGRAAIPPAAAAPAC